MIFVELLNFLLFLANEMENSRIPLLKKICNKKVMIIFFRKDIFKKLKNEHSIYLITYYTHKKSIK